MASNPTLRVRPAMTTVACGREVEASVRRRKAMRVAITLEKKKQSRRDDEAVVRGSSVNKCFTCCFR